jgi:signal recognition particle receptor subunit beta
MQQIQDPTGRTLFFDRVVARVSNVVFQVYTVAGQRRHKFQRQTVLKGTDACIFTWDSLIDQWGECIWSLKELLRFYGNRLIPEKPYDPPDVPMVVLANKRDLEDIVEISKIRKALDTAHLNHTLIYETIAIQGINVKRAFVYAARQAVLNHYKKLSGKSMEEA